MIIEQVNTMHTIAPGRIITSKGDLITNFLDLEGEFISVRDAALIRVRNGRKENGTRVAMLAYYFKGKPPVLRKEQIGEELALKIAEAHSVHPNDKWTWSDDGKYYFTRSNEEYELVREEAERQEKVAPEKRTAIICPLRDSFSMTHQVNSKYLKFFFEDMSQQSYGNDYLDVARYMLFPASPEDRNDFTIKFVPIDKETVDGKSPKSLTNPYGTIINVLWFESGMNGSVLRGDIRKIEGKYYDLAERIKYAN